MRTRALVAVPARNEAAILPQSLASLQNLFRRHSKEFEWHVVISDNGSTDATGIEAKRIVRSHRNVSYIHSSQPGKGLAIRAAWESRAAEVYAFTDADLAADIEILPSLARSILDGNDICVASRRLSGAKVDRPIPDRITSLALNALVRLLCRTSLTDTSCGMKAVSPRVVRELVPQVRNTSWAFDTELPIVAQRLGYTLRDIPVAWREPRRSDIWRRLRVPSIAWEYISTLRRLGRDSAVPGSAKRSRP